MLEGRLKLIVARGPLGLQVRTEREVVLEDALDVVQRGQQLLWPWLWLDGNHK